MSNGAHMTRGREDTVSDSAPKSVEYVEYCPGCRQEAKHCEGVTSACQDLTWTAEKHKDGRLEPILPDYHAKRLAATQGQSAK